MKNLKLYRIMLNILFYIFYVLILSLIFTFIFPIIQISLWLNIWDLDDTRFDIIQIIIIFLVLVFSLIFRKYFYLPITLNTNIKNDEVKNNKTYTSYTKRVKEEIKNSKEESIIDDWLELDIKIGKEIK